MEQSRTRWPDERLDDLSRRTDAGFEQVHQDFLALRAKMAQGFRDGQRLMIQLMGGVMGTILATLITVVLTRG